jgi:hypothetical protein
LEWEYVFEYYDAIFMTSPDTSEYFTHSDGFILDEVGKLKLFVVKLSS